MNVDAALLDGGRRRGVAVLAQRVVGGVLLFLLVELDVVNNCTHFAIHTDGEELRAVVLGRGHPDLIAPDDRRRPALVMDGRLPDDVLRLAPRQRQTDGVGMAVVVGAAEQGPVVAGQGGGGQGCKSGQDQGDAHERPRGWRVGGEPHRVSVYGTLGRMGIRNTAHRRASGRTEIHSGNPAAARYTARVGGDPPPCLGGRAVWSIRGHGPRLCDGLTSPRVAARRRPERLRPVAARPAGCTGGRRDDGSRRSRASSSSTSAARRSTRPGTPSPTRRRRSAANSSRSATNVPGIQVGELMPRTARLMDKICILRGMSTDDNAHSSSGYWMLTGVPHQPTNSENSKPGAPNDWPCTAADRAATAARRRRPAGLGRDPGTHLEHRQHRLARPGRRLPRPLRRPLAHPLRSESRRISRSPAWRRRPTCRRCACRTGCRCWSRSTADSTPSSRRRRSSASTPAAGRRSTCCARHGRGAAFDLDKEPPALRDRYGRNRWGQSVLLARRLVEARRVAGAGELDAGGRRHQRQPGLGHARQERPALQDGADAEDGPRLFGPAGRPGRPRPAGRHAGGVDGRVRPVAEDQRRRRPRPLGPRLFGRPGRRRRPRRPGPSAPPTRSAAIRATAGCSRRT